MTRKEAVEVLRKLPVGLMDLDNKQKWDLTEAIGLALTALRAPTREQVEKMRGFWEQGDPYDIGDICSKCGYDTGREPCKWNFCPACGQPKTDEAVDMMLERWKEAPGND